MRRWVPLAAALALPPGAFGQAEEALPRIVRVEPPRDAAHHIGDVVEYRALLRWPAGWEIDRDGLPVAARDGHALELRGHRVEPAAAPGCTDCRWLALRWQVFKAVRITEDVPLPATAVRLRHGTRIETLTLPAARIALSPLVPWERRADWLDSARPGWQASPYDTAAHWRQAALLLGAAAVALGGWAWTSGRWLPRPARRPFAQAWRAVRARHRGRSTAPVDADDLRDWHRAFDATAGRVVMAADLPGFFAEHPALAPLAEESRAMFAASQRRFFLEAGEAAGAGASLVQAGDLVGLLGRLAAAEFGRPAARAPAEAAA
ncbi:hypothetical protein V4F39_05895 [Aquincola sp. MAHUQ-54]|uniref:MxaA protein n=1 Tax=Aquincola agrisoli TaxID=3119538 RepID=A0AAW9Q039_9BURK